MPFFKQDQEMKRAFRLALSYTLLVYSSLYFTPFLAAVLRTNHLLRVTVDYFHLFFGISLLAVLFYRYRIRHLLPYLLITGVAAVFLDIFFRTHLLVERFHYLEYALIFSVWFRVFRHQWRGLFLYGFTILFSCMLGAVDEGLQGLLPNRVSELSDIGINVIGVLFGALSVLILMHCRRDKRGLRFLKNPKSGTAAPLGFGGKDFEIE